MNDRETINIVWLKRDLRLHDNEAIANAIIAKKRFLIVFVFENMLMDDPTIVNDIGTL